MRWSRVALLVVSLVAVLGLVSACVDSSEKDAQTPAGAKTVANSAIQTNSKGETITAPASGGSTSGGSPTTGGSSTAGGSTSGGAAAGDVAAGKTVFAASCTACHMGDGTQAGGVGPQLSGAGLTADQIKTQVQNGGGPMPAGLVSGTDLDNVVAYVLSLQ